MPVTRDSVQFLSNVAMMGRDYASHQTNAAEAKYAPTELEAAALVYTVEHFEVYILGNQTTVFTDHQALVSAFLSHMKSQTKGILVRCYLRISRFLPTLKIEFKPGATNVIADALSRAPVASESSGSVLLVEYSQTELHKEQRKDQVWLTYTGKMKWHSQKSMYKFSRRFNVKLRELMLAGF